MSRRRPLLNGSLPALTATAAAIGLLLTPAVRAQEAAAPPAATASAPEPAEPAKAAPAPKVEQVVITATRRREPIREVPMAVDTLSASELEKSGAQNLTDYLSAQPGVEVQSWGGTGLGAIAVRGVTTGDQTSATVGTYIDDTAFGSSTAYALGSTTALDMGLLDLNHIELLRGPQGTLYGAGAMGGVLKYVTNDPDASEFFGSLSAGGRYTEHGEWGNTVNGILNVPLKEDTAAMRVAAFRDQVAGYVDVVGPAAAKDVNGGTTTGGRIAFLLEPTSRFRVRLTATTQDIERDGTDYVDYDGATGRPIHGDLTKQLFVAEPYSVKIDLASADLEYDFGSARFNSVTAWQHNRVNHRIDDSAVLVPALAAAGLELGTTPFDQSVDLKKTTQEFRLTSAAGQPIEWLAGLWFDDERASNDQLVTSTLPDGSEGPDLAQAAQPSIYREYAAYGDLTWNATPRLALTAGARVARNEQTYTQRSDGLLFGGLTELTGDSEETSETWLGTARYALTPESNAYVRIASGYRPGGPNAVVRDPVTGDPLAPTTFEHDSLWSYEAGYKAELADKSLAFEAAVYDVEWSNIQQFYAVNNISVIVNAGDARVKGLELGSTWRPDARWNLHGSVAAVDARLVQDAPGLASSGARLPLTPEFSGTVGATFAFALGGHASYATLDEHYTGERNAGYDGSATAPNYHLPAYWLTNLSAGIDFGRMDIALFVRNAFDARGQAAASTGMFASGGPVQVSPVLPRTVGVTFTGRF